MTPAIDLLKKLAIQFRLHSFEHTRDVTHYGPEVIAKLQLNPQQVFKTLIVVDETNKHNLAVMLVAVAAKLNLKAAATLLCCKKVALADSSLAQRTTGYLIGGISPLGQKQQLPTFIDHSAKQFRTIFVSAGKRGMEIELAPCDLLELTKAQYKQIQY